MKYCPKCDQMVPLELWGNNPLRTDGLQSYCKPCRKIYNANYHKKHKKELIPKRVDRQREVREANKNRLLIFLADKKCVDCGNSDGRVLEFDHTDSTNKTKNVSDLIQRNSWKRVLDEIEKCDIVCANCHRIRTYSRMGSYRLSTEWVDFFSKEE